MSYDNVENEFFLEAEKSHRNSWMWFSVIVGLLAPLVVYLCFLLYVMENIEVGLFFLFGYIIAVGCGGTMLVHSETTIKNARVNHVLGKTAKMPTYGGAVLKSLFVMVFMALLSASPALFQMMFYPQLKGHKTFAVQSVNKDKYLTPQESKEKNLLRLLNAMTFDSFKPEFRELKILSSEKQSDGATKYRLLLTASHAVYMMPKTSPNTVYVSRDRTRNDNVPAWGIITLLATANEPQEVKFTLSWDMRSGFIEYADDITMRLLSAQYVSSVNGILLKKGSEAEAQWHAIWENFPKKSLTERKRIEHGMQLFANKWSGIVLERLPEEVAKFVSATTEDESLLVALNDIFGYRGIVFDSLEIKSKGKDQNKITYRLALKSTVSVYARWKASTGSNYTPPLEVSKKLPEWEFVKMVAEADEVKDVTFKQFNGGAWELIYVDDWKLSEVFADSTLAKEKKIFLQQDSEASKKWEGILRWTTKLNEPRQSEVLMEINALSAKYIGKVLRRFPEEFNKFMPEIEKVAPWLKKYSRQSVDKEYKPLDSTSPQTRIDNKPTNGGDNQPINVLSAFSELKKVDPKISEENRLKNTSDESDMKVLQFKLRDNVVLYMIKIKAGTFLMGSPENEIGRENDLERQHSVTLKNDFWIGKYEITQEQYEAVTGKNPSSDKGADYPVVNVSWRDARLFCKELNIRLKEQLPKGYWFDLPAEAQWEYACRAGCVAALYNGKELITEWNGGDALAEIVLTVKDGSRAVGQKVPNKWGLYDMLGSIAEYVRDPYRVGYVHARTAECPPEQESFLRVLRGGARNYKASKCRSASRGHVGADYAADNQGFRVALVVKPTDGGDNLPVEELPTFSGLKKADPKVFERRQSQEEMELQNQLNAIVRSSCWNFKIS